jgi:hypothetical protein
MAVSATQIFLGGTTKVFAMPKAGNALATEYGAAQGITSTHLDYDIEFGAGSLFSVDSTTSTSASRLFRIFDGNAWGPAAWDLSPTYPASSPAYSLAFDGTNLLMATRHTSTKVDFYASSTSAAGAPVLLGTNTSVYYVVGFAADSQYFYVAGTGIATPGEGVFRISRANVAAPAVKLASIDTSTLKTHVDIDDLVSPQNLYVRAYGGDIHAIANPAQANFLHIGPINTLGTTSDYGMTFDHASKRLYFYETETNASGRIMEMQ